MGEPLVPLGVLPGKQHVRRSTEYSSLLVVLWDHSLGVYVRFGPTTTYSSTSCSGTDRPCFVEMVCYLIDGRGLS